VGIVFSSRSNWSGGSGFKKNRLVLFMLGREVIAIQWTSGTFFDIFEKKILKQVFKRLF
jgi:hypothetical protein